MNTKLTIKLNDILKVNKFTNEITKFKSDIDITRERYIIDAKSLLALFTLDLSQPVNIEIHSDDNAEIVEFNKLMEEFI